MGWPNEPHRHALARRGIRTRAIPNPIADPEHYNPNIYEDNWLKNKARRPFKGSGLENISKWDVIEQIDDFLYEFDGTKEKERDWDMRGYYDLLKSMSRDFDMQYDEFEKMFDEGGKFFEVKAIYLFGSRVTGFWTPYSDVDVYIQLKRRKDFDNDTLEYMAEKLKDAVESYLADEGKSLSIYDEGRLVSVDVPIITTESPDINLGEDVPVLEIWREGD